MPPLKASPGRGRRVKLSRRCYLQGQQLPFFTPTLSTGQPTRLRGTRTDDPQPPQPSNPSTHPNVPSSSSLLPSFLPRLISESSSSSSSLDLSSKVNFSEFFTAKVTQFWPSCRLKVNLFPTRRFSSWLDGQHPRSRPSGGAALTYLERVERGKEGRMTGTI